MIELKKIDNDFLTGIIEEVNNLLSLVPFSPIQMMPKDYWNNPTSQSLWLHAGVEYYEVSHLDHAEVIVKMVGRTRSELIGFFIKNQLEESYYLNNQGFTTVEDFIGYCKKIIRFTECFSSYYLTNGMVVVCDYPFLNMLKGRFPDIQLPSPYNQHIGHSLYWDSQKGYIDVMPQENGDLLIRKVGYTKDEVVEELSRIYK